MLPIKREHNGSTDVEAQSSGSETRDKDER